MWLSWKSVVFFFFPSAVGNGFLFPLQLCAWTKAHTVSSDSSLAQKETAAIGVFVAACAWAWDVKRRWTACPSRGTRGVGALCIWIYYSWCINGYGCHPFPSVSVGGDAAVRLHLYVLLLMFHFFFFLYFTKTPPGCYLLPLHLRPQWKHVTLLLQCHIWNSWRTPTHLPPLFLSCHLYSCKRGSYCLQC